MRTFHRQILNGAPITKGNINFFPLSSIKALVDARPEDKDLQAIDKLIQKYPNSQFLYHQHLMHNVFRSNSIENALETCEKFTGSSEEIAHIEGVELFLNVMLSFKIIFGVFFHTDIEDDVRNNLIAIVIKFFSQVSLRNDRTSIFPSLIKLLKSLKNIKTPWCIFASIAMFYLINFIQKLVGINDIDEFKLFLEVLNGKIIINLNCPHMSSDVLVLESKV